MKQTLRLLALAAMFGAAASSARAQVQPNGFVVKHEVTVSASPAKVYGALVTDIGRWWNPNHTYSGDSKNLSIDARVGGCFCEKLANGGGIEHMRVIYVAPNEVLRMSGALGPLQSSGVAGSLTWKLTGAGTGTKVEMTYVAGGHMEGGFESIAQPVNGVMLEQLRRLKSFVETGHAASQAADPRADNVDALFAGVNETTPGCAVAVIRDGKTILARGYGMADLERNVRITPQTVFDIGSTSKQFTAASVLLLEREGKLSLDEDVRKYVPELPAYERPVTIRHLLHHTSGIRDYLTLMALSGFSFSNDYSDEETIGWIARQKALNFLPGEEHLYSNSGYYLLSQIVERASGTSLRAYADKKIFAPLEMRNTHFHDDPTEIVKNRAIAYAPREKGFAIDMSMYHVTGDGAVLTTVEDLARWDANFDDPKVGGKDLIAALLRRGKLASGEEIDYASGLVHGKHKGLPTVAHGGAWAGYRAQFVRFPEQRLSVIVLSNAANGDPGGKALKIAEIYLENEMNGQTKASAKTPDEAVSIAREELQKLTGVYFNAKNSFYRTVELRDGKLWYVRGGGSANELRPLGTNRFLMVGVPSPAYVVFDGNQARVEPEGQPPTELSRVTTVSPSAADLAAYAGEYRSEELMAPQRVRMQDGKLVVRSGYEREEVALEPRERDTFEARGVILRFERDGAGNVTGYTISAGRVKGIRFTRLGSSSAPRAASDEQER